MGFDGRKGNTIFESLVPRRKGTVIVSMMLLPDYCWVSQAMGLCFSSLHLPIQPWGHPRCPARKEGHSSAPQSYSFVIPSGQHPSTHLTSWTLWPNCPASSWVVILQMFAAGLLGFGGCDSTPCCSHRNTLHPPHNARENCWVSEACCFNLHGPQCSWWRELTTNHSHRCFVFLFSSFWNPEGITHGL